MSPRKQLPVVFATVLLAACGPDQRTIPETGYRDWLVYGGGWDSIRYSALDQINTRNVDEIEVTWTYDSWAPACCRSYILARSVLDEPSSFLRL